MPQTLHYGLKLMIIVVVALFSLIQFLAKESDWMVILA